MTIDKQAQTVLQELYHQFETDSEVSISSPDYDQLQIDYLIDAGLLSKIDASTLSGWTYIVIPTYRGEITISEMSKKPSSKVYSFIEQGEIIMKEEYHHVTEPGLIMPDYISGPKSDQWFSEIKIFNDRFLSEHPLHDSIDKACASHRRSFSAHEDMMGYLRALQNDEELDMDNRPSSNAPGISQDKDHISQQNANIAPKVFISYSWEDEDHKEWVRSLTDSLLANGIDATLDQYDLSLGDRLPQFMEQSITESDYVLIICTPTYKAKSDKRSGGVGYEGHIISGELLTTRNERKFIPVIRKGSLQTAMPNCLAGKLGIDLSNDSHYSVNFNDLLTTLHGQKKKPPISHTLQNKSTESSLKLNNEPLRILGIITDQVTVPKMDGTRGSALYMIPFRLSRQPSILWGELFIQAWNSPPKFTTMHRPGIAAVSGDRIILDGTTIEEVQKYHRDTLQLCVTIANEKETQILKEEQLERERKAAQEREHYSNVAKIADDISFE